MKIPVTNSWSLTLELTLGLHAQLVLKKTAILWLSPGKWRTKAVGIIPRSMARLTKNKREVNKIQKEKDITTDRKMIIKGGPHCKWLHNPSRKRSGVRGICKMLAFRQGGNCFQADKQRDERHRSPGASGFLGEFCCSPCEHINNTLRVANKASASH